MAVGTIFSGDLIVLEKALLECLGPERNKFSTGKHSMTLLSQSTPSWMLQQP